MFAYMVVISSSSVGSQVKLTIAIETSVIKAKICRQHNIQQLPFVTMRLAVVIVLVGVISAATAAPIRNTHRNKDDLAKIEELIAELQNDDTKDANEKDDDDDDDTGPHLQSFWKKALGHGLKYAAGLFGKKQKDDNEVDKKTLAKLQGLLKKALRDAKEQDNDNNQAEIEDLFAKLQDGDGDDDDDTDPNEKKMAKLQSFWKKALRHGLKYAAGLFGEKQKDDNEVDKKTLAKLQGLLKKALGDAKEQDNDNNHAEIEDLFAKLQDGDDDDDDDDDDTGPNEKKMAKLQSFWKKALRHGLKYASSLFAKKQHGGDNSLAKTLLDKLSNLE